MPRFSSPSQLRSEAFGLVQLEAAMRSKPLICTELSTGTSYVNIHGKTGMVIPPENAGALRNAMNVLAQNPQLSVSMGCRARERFIELFTSERMYMILIPTFIKRRSSFINRINNQKKIYKENRK